MLSIVDSERRKNSLGFVLGKDFNNVLSECKKRERKEKVCNLFYTMGGI